MHKFAGWIALVIGFWAHLCTISSALAEPHGVTDSVTVRYGGEEDQKKEQKYPTLLIGNWVAEDTRIIYSAEGLTFPAARNGFVFVFPGTGGAATGPFGLAMSMSPTVHELVKKQRPPYAAAAFQNPVYLDIEKYSTLEAMLQWQLRVMHQIKEQLPSGTPLFYVGRSTGAGLGMELLHRYLRGDPGYEIVGEFVSMTFYGIEGHKTEQRDRWLAKELDAPGTNERVARVGYDVYGEMSFQTQQLPEIKDKKIPRLVLSAGSRDDFAPLSDILESVQDFEKMHPGVTYELALHHGAHEPSKAITDGNRKIVENFECLRMILERSFSKEPPKREGRNLIYLPGEEKVWEGQRDKWGQSALTAAKAVMGDTRADLFVAGPTNSATVQINPAMILPGSVPVKFEGGDYSGVLYTADIPELHTRAIYPKKGLWFEGATGITIIITGTSSRVDSEYGPERSMSPVAKELINKRGQSVLVLTPPIYYLSTDEVARQPYLAKYRQTEENMRWFLEVLKYVKSKVPPGTEINFHGRSFGAGIGMEAYHRFQRGDAGYEIIGELNRMLFMGVDGHKPAAIDAWHTNEKKYYLETPEGRLKGDPPVVLAGKEIFEGFSWQTERLAPLAAGKKAPKLVAATGANDEFSEPNTSLGPIKDFAELHPGADMTLAFHHAGHDPGKGVTKGDRRIIMPLEALRMILGYMYDTVSAGPGFHLRYFPDQPTVEGYLDARGTDQVVLCNAVLSASGGT